MDERELARFLPDIVEYLPEGMASGFDVLLPAGPTDHGSWNFRYGPVLVVLHISTNALLSITAGVALDVPFTSEVSHEINALNAKFVTVGRFFLVEFEGTGRGVILMQEVFYGEAVSWEYPASMRGLVQVIGKIAAGSARVSPALCERFGGHPPADEAGLLILVEGGG